MISLQTLRRKREPFFEYQVIKPLVTSTSGKVGLGLTTEIAFGDLGVTDYKAPYELFLLYGESIVPATLVTPAELRWNEQNQYQQANVSKPQYAIYSSKEIWFRPGISADDTINNAITFYYYQAPPKITVSGGTITDLTISERAHECILYYVLSKCFDKDKEIELAKKYTEAYEKEFNIICQ